jgi:hypothetical protein
MQVSAKSNPAPTSVTMPKALGTLDGPSQCERSLSKPIAESFSPWNAPSFCSRLPLPVVVMAVLANSRLRHKGRREYVMSKVPSELGGATIVRKCGILIQPGSMRDHIYQSTGGKLLPKRRFRASSAPGTSRTKHTGPTVWRSAAVVAVGNLCHRVIGRQFGGFSLRHPPPRRGRSRLRPAR